MNKKTAGFNVAYIFLAALGVLMVQDWWARSQAVATLPYSQFQQLVREDKVAKVTVSQDQVAGELKEPLNGKTRFVAIRVDSDMAKELDQHGVTYAGRYDSDFVAMLLSWVVPIALFFGVWLLLSRRMAKQLGAGGPGGGLMSIGKSKAKVYVETDTKTTFADVAGVDEAKEELKEIVTFLKDPKSYGRLGARMPKGVLLVGPPGTGKTLLAKAVAGEASVPFFSISGSEFVEMFVGVGAARVRDLFEQARAKAPAIIFIDELDALGRARASMPGMSGGHDEKEQTLNQLLVELDGFDPSAGIVLLAATNRPEILDPALLRAGRFDRQMLVDRPDRVGRLAILKVHTQRVVLDDGVKLEEVAALTPGFTGADLANLVNEAALVATRRQADKISMEDFNVAVERIVAGLEKKNRLLNPREREVVAHHEMGHALVAAGLAGTDPVHKISIIPRGIGALGYTIQRPTEDRYLMTREELQSKMAVLLGGRAAERLVFDHLSTGASDDLSKATEIARSMVTRYGMGEALGPVTYETEPNGYLGELGTRRLYSEATAREIDVAVRELVEGAFQRASAILTDNRALLDLGAAELLARETLAGDELQALLGRVAGDGPRVAAASAAG
ncbi:ATP-dependent metalloprotease FtsH [Anaeromyxobacter dehalogenans 2CP-1]|uniref:ATP-dependent zinc metalloprotease FtsH n=1 Tax=Anaeromyxobacter dehalogenans (strain ATCC BAA-258 / DSM 21875 / 2CP-1) TaxID=455488 RepID=B8JCJ4_ANAD2|nr:ATP-dependent zinc metalloprotease FtsH [Anaeromyxobacter dehalogenans]ACL67714.1 ATP-dependent metalloprotease FtsH [Anaeromyxobacter dehalogenans 2CP-1]